MYTYADIRGAYMDGCLSASETVSLLFGDPPTDLPATVLAEMREMASVKGINACTIDVLVGMIVGDPIEALDTAIAAQAADFARTIT